MVDERIMDGWMVHFGLEKSAHIHSSSTLGDRDAALDSQCPIREEDSRHGRQATGDGRISLGHDRSLLDYVQQSQITRTWMLPEQTMDIIICLADRFSIASYACKRFSVFILLCGLD